MSYELFRNDVLMNLNDAIPSEMVTPAINAVDRAAISYEVVSKPVSLMVVDGEPQLMKLYLGSKATEGLSKDTLKNYYYTLHEFFLTVAKRVDAIDSNDIRCYLYDYQQRSDNSNRTLNQRRSHIDCFFDWCVRNNYLPSNPCATVNKIKYYATPRDPFTTVELEYLRLACRNVRESAIINLLYSTGLRVTELCHLKIEDIDLHDKSVKVLHGKGDKYRLTYLNAKAVVSLKQYFKSRTDDCPYVIVNARGPKHGLTKKSIELIVRNICARAGLDPKKAHPHNLRHTFATVMIQNGAPVQHVQKLLGHAKLETTMIYAKDRADDIKRTHERCVI